MKNELEISLDYIDMLYKERDLAKSDRTQYIMREKVRDILRKTKKEIDFALGRVPEEKILRYLEIREPSLVLDWTEEEEKRLEEIDRELEKFHKQRFKIEVNVKLYELIKEILPSSTYGERDPLILGPDIFEDFRDHIPTLRLNPLKLIFNVWHKAFKEGQYSKNKKIEKVLFEFKEKTKDTDKEYLFNSLSKLEFESLRKSSLYRLQNFYKDLAQFIYQKSFIEKQ